MSKVVPIAARSDTVSTDREDTAQRCFYMVQAALDIMEGLFGDSHESVTGHKNTWYVPPDQLDLILYLLYECSNSARALRNNLST